MVLWVTQKLVRILKMYDNISNIMGMFIVYLIPAKTCNHGIISLILIEDFFLEHVNNFGWREQVETTSTRPVNHIREIKFYNKILWLYNIKPTVHWL